MFPIPNLPSLLFISRIVARLPPEVRVAASPLTYGRDDLLPEERSQVERAVPKRVREFATGRVLARALLRSLGLDDGALVAGPDRAPRWPGGAVGSITHDDERCVVAVARASEVASLGIDVEARGPLDEALFDTVLTRRETEALGAHDPARRGELAKLSFSAKECFYKCQHPITGIFLDFVDVEIDLDLDAGRFRVRVLRADVLRALNRFDLGGHVALDDHALATAMSWAAAP